MINRDLAWAFDPVVFARDAMGFDADEWQARVLRWSGKRLLLNCSRQSGKSTTTAMLALHRALYRPGSLILLISPSLRQSSELFRKVTDGLDKLATRPAMKEDNRLSCVLENGSRIVSLPSTEATIRGFSGVDLIIEDEAARVSDDLYFACRPMLAVSGGRMILMSTPYGKRGHFYTEWTEGADWERVRVKATECPRIAPEFLEAERRGLPDRVYRQEYGCEFLQTDDAVFNLDDFDAAVDYSIKPLFGRGGNVD
jgi:hypothetical protein